MEYKNENWAKKVAEYKNQNWAKKLAGYKNFLCLNLAAPERHIIHYYSKQEKVLGVTIDNKLNFKTHLLNITKNANIKFNALTRIQKHMNADQKKTYILFIY